MEIVLVAFFNGDTTEAEARLEAECIRHKDTEEQLNVLKAQIREKEDIIKSLEARVKELEKENNNLKFNIIEYMKKENLKLEAKVKKLEKFKGLYGLASQDRDKLEALLIEACEEIDEYLEADGSISANGLYDFLNKPEIKKLLEGENE